MDTGPAAVRLLVAVASLGLVAAGAVAVRTIGDTDCIVPVVVGRSEDRGRDELAAAGIDEAQVASTRVADASPEGQVVSQGPSGCSGPLELVVSDGGPALPAQDVPEPYLGLLGDPAPQQLVRRITTPLGDAYKIDDLLVGDCEAARLAVADVADTDFGVRCRPPLEQRLLQVLLTTTSTWWGQPPSGGRGARSGIADNYMGTAWGARLRVDGWELQVDVTISASRESGPGPSRTVADATVNGEDRTDRVNRAVLAVVTASDNTVVDILLVPVRAGPVGSEPVTIAELRTLADDLLVVASTA